MYCARRCLPIVWRFVGLMGLKTYSGVHKLLCKIGDRREMGLGRFSLGEILTRWGTYRSKIRGELSFRLIAQPKYTQKENRITEGMVETEFVSCSTGGFGSFAVSIPMDQFYNCGDPRQSVLKYEAYTIPTKPLDEPNTNLPNCGESA